MTEANDRQGQSEIVIDLRQLLWALIKGSWLIVIFGCIGIIIAILHLHDHVPQYKATYIIAPTNEAGQSSDLSGKLGILTSITGNFGGVQRVTIFDRLQQVFRSREFAKNLDQKYKLIKLVYGSSWDEEKQSWVAPTGTRHEWREKVNKFLNQSVWHAPDLESLSRYLSSIIVFKKLQDTPFFEVTVSHRDSEYALWLLQVAYKEAEKILRLQDRQQVQERQNYLQEKLASVQLQDVRQMFLAMLQREVRQEMLLDSDLPYAARVIETAHVSSRPTAPSVNFEIGWRVGLGIALAIFIVLAHYFWRRS